ncbi:MAG: exopolysaccharide transport family protein [Rhodobacter sp.]|nr:exopolysaccharide transport family protein [Rhodobacter sp.]
MAGEFFWGQRMIDQATSRHRWEIPGSDDDRGAPGPASAPLFGIDAQSLLAIALRWKGSIAAIGLLMAIATYIVLSQVAPTFTAKTQVMLGTGAAPVINIPNVVPEANPTVAYAESAVIVMQSTDVLRAVVQELDLDRREEFNPALGTPSVLGRLSDLLRTSLRAIVPGRNGATGADVAIPGERDPLSGTIRGLRKAVSVRVLGESQVIEVKAQSRSPRLAAAIADTVAQKYIDRQLETKYLAGDQATDWLEGRADELRDVLRASERRVADFRKTQISDGQEMAAELAPQLAELTDALTRLTAEHSELLARRDEVSQLFAAGNFAALARLLEIPTITALHEQVSDVDARIVQGQLEFGEHASVRRLRQTREQVEQRLKAEVEGVLSGLEVRIGILDRRRFDLDGRLQLARAELADRERVELQLLDLEREAQASREVYNTFLLRLKETRERSQFQSADARIISAAEVPVFPSAPQKGKLSVIFAIGGSALALFGLAVFADNRPRVGDPRQVAQRTGIGSVRQIPYLRGAGTPIGLLEYISTAPESKGAEAIRRLRLSVASKDPRQVNIIMVTSADHSEGKTALSLSLAEIFAREGFNTALVNADPSNGDLAELLKSRDAESIGFDIVDCLDHERPPFDIEDSPDDGLTALLGTLKRRKVIIIDTPPALRSADVIDIGMLANHTIVACAWNQTPNETLEQCIAVLRQAGVDIEAIAINKVPQGRMQDADLRSRPIVPPRVSPPRALPPPQPAA